MQRGRVDEQGVRAAVFLEGPEIFRLRAQVLGGVENERAGGAESRVGVAEAEPLEVQHAERLHHRARAGHRVEVIGGKLGAGASGGECLEGMHYGLLVRGGAPGVDRALGHQRLARIEGSEHGQQVFRMRVGGDLELAG